MTITFKYYDKNNKLDMLNKKLHKNSKGRYVLFKSKRNIYYMIDYDEISYNKIIRNYNEIKDILSCMDIDIKEWI